jgi:hypothetical protein
VSVTVVLTAAVTPTVTQRVSVADPGQRAREYAAALTRWAGTARQLGLNLVVVETTGAPREALWPAGVEGRHLSFVADPADSARGKGAVEAAAIDHALAHAPELRAGTAYKCTGRLWVANAADLLGALPPTTARIRRTLDWSWVDSRLVGASVDLWRGALAGMGADVDDRAGHYLEHVLADRLRRAWATDGAAVQRLGRRPVYVGRSGSTGIDYRSPRERLKGAVLQPLESLLAGPLATKLL